MSSVARNMVRDFVGSDVADLRLEDLREARQRLAEDYSDEDFSWELGRLDMAIGMLEVADVVRGAAQGVVEEVLKRLNETPM